MENLQIVPYTQERVEDVLDFERRLREEEDFWGWDIDEAYTAAVRQSFQDPRFANALSLLAYRDGQVVGRIDATLICTRFDGSVKAYLDWVCVLKSQRHRGTAQALMAGLRRRLKEAGADTLIGLIAANPEAQRFYRSLEGAKIQDEGIWIDL
ncbi:MAG: GNAT family N-acetyltransferase [Oscillospiraceae bacterium]|nr:GNAT family N-acetyltransferase [Oscillospiraceae bacterium]